MKCSLAISNFLEEISSLFAFYCFPLFPYIIHLGRLSCLSLLFFGILHSDCYLSFSTLPLASLLFSVICKASSDNHFAFLHFFFLGMVLSLPREQCYKPPSIILQALFCLSDLIPWIYLSLPLYNFKGFKSYLNGLVVFSTFLQFKSEFDNKEFMIWAMVSSQSCFCWLYKASPSLVPKNRINLISVLTIWWCPCIESSLVLLEGGVCYDHCILWQNSISLCPALFCTPRPNLPVTPDVSWLPTFAFQSP